MFYYETGKEIKNSFLRIALFVFIDILWIVGMYLIFKPLVIIAVVYALFSITMIYPQYVAIFFLRSLNSIYASDKSDASIILQTNINALHEVASTQDETVEIQTYKDHPETQSRMERANRKSANRLRRKYKLYIVLRDIVIKELEEEIVQEKNEFI